MIRLGFLPLLLLLCQNGLAYTAAELYKKVIPSIVTVITFDTDGKTPLCSGTGFFLHSDMLVNNKHVVLNTERIDAKPEKKGYFYLAVTLDGKELPRTQEVYEDADYDLAFVFFRGINMPVTGNLDYNPDLGLHVIVIGSPSPKKLHGTILSGTLSQGYINAPLRDGGRLIQTDVPFTHGNSGSPMFNDNGGIVGVADAVIEETTITFAIPASLLSTAWSTYLMSVGPQPEEKATKLVDPSELTENSYYARSLLEWRQSGSSLPFVNWLAEKIHDELENDLKHVEVPGSSQTPTTAAPQPTPYLPQLPPLKELTPKEGIASENRSPREEEILEDYLRRHPLGKPDDNR